MYANRGGVPEMTQGLPLVTAVVTTYDRPQLVQRAIKSVLAQTYEPLEIIVVEDGSESGIEVWLREENPDHVQYIHHEKNLGLAAARNTGFRYAKGRYVAYLDDDDEWAPEKVARQVELAEASTDAHAVIYCGASLISVSGKVVGEIRPRLRGDVRTTIGKNGLFTIPSSCLFRRGALEQVGGYDESLPSHIDHDIWLELGRHKYAAECVDECLVRVPRHQEARMTVDAETRLRATDVFCHKWRPELETWFGRRAANRYCLEFAARVTAILGWACVYRGDRREAARHFLSALARDPMNLGVYKGLIAAAVGGGPYDRLVRAWKGYV